MLSALGRQARSMNPLARNAGTLLLLSVTIKQEKCLLTNFLHWQVQYCLRIMSFLFCASVWILCKSVSLYIARDARWTFSQCNSYKGNPSKWCLPQANRKVCSSLQSLYRNDSETFRQTLWFVQIVFPLQQRHANILWQSLLCCSSMWIPKIPAWHFIFQKGYREFSWNWPKDVGMFILSIFGPLNFEHSG